MSALYAMRYVGQSGLGVGAIYIGKGSIVGVDAANIRFSGTYTEDGGRIKASLQMTAPAGGSPLVTGGTLAEGQSVPLTADWPANFADGSSQAISVMGRQVQVSFEKIGDIP